MAIDNKYGRVTTEHGTIGEDEPVVVFRARDVNLPFLLDRYAEMCEDTGSPERHLELIEETQAQVMAWQTTHRDQVKIPDSEASRAWRS